ncbi:cell division protein FtsX [Portibacter lacus]|nr:FtsX-like permease family protein [Portibacter lacus]
MIAIKSNAVLKTLKNETSVLVEVEPGITDDLIPRFAALPGVIPNSVSFTSSQDAKRIMEEELGSAFLDLQGENPFFDTYQFNMEKGSVNIPLLRSMKEVHDAYAQSSYVDQISTNVRKFSRLALIVGIFFSALAITLIFNAINLSLAESKSSFYTLKLLGSDWNFIKRPFLQRAFYSGLLSGGIAILLFVIAMTYFMLSNDTIGKIISIWNVILVAFIMLLVGFLVNLLSTNAILNRFLTMKEEDLYT